MNALIWHPATSADTEAVTRLFAAAEGHRPVGLETDVDAIADRLDSHAAESLMAVDDGGAVHAYAEAAAMGIAEDTVRIRLTAAIDPSADAGVSDHVYGWLTRQRHTVHAATASKLPALVALRCHSGDIARRDFLRRQEFQVVRWEHFLTRPLTTALPHHTAPDGVTAVPYDQCYDEDARIAHNEVYEGDAMAIRPSQADWPDHATGLTSFLPETSFLAMTGQRQIAAFTFCLRDGQGSSALLHCLGTRRQWRRSGIATWLISRSLQALARSGFTDVNLQVSAGNEDAISLYTGLGFSNTGGGYTTWTCTLPPHTT